MTNAAHTHSSGDIDLHTHSTASDGALTPTELVAAAANAGVRTLALTDHDTVAGIEEAQAAATTHGLQLVPGVEVSVTWENRTLHIVGLAIEPANTTLQAGLQTLQQTRRDRAQRMGERLEKLGVADALARAKQLAGDGQITRPHFARLLIDDGLCKNMQQCFSRYLKFGKRAYVRAEWAALDDAIGWIHAAGGLAVLAHPHAYKMSGAWRRRMYTAFKEAGGDATEVCCGASNSDQIRTSAADAVAHGLAGSAGTDFHSPEQRWLRLGRLPPMPRQITPVWEHSGFRISSL